MKVELEFDDFIEDVNSIFDLNINDIKVRIRSVIKDARVIFICKNDAYCYLKNTFYDINHLNIKSICSINPNSYLYESNIKYKLHLIKFIEKYTNCKFENLPDIIKNSYLGTLIDRLDDFKEKSNNNNWPEHTKIN